MASPPHGALGAPRVLRRPRLLPQAELQLQCQRRGWVTSRPCSRWGLEQPSPCASPGLSAPPAWEGVQGMLSLRAREMWGVEEMGGLRA